MGHELKFAIVFGVKTLEHGNNIQTFVLSSLWSSPDVKPELFILPPEEVTKGKNNVFVNGHVLTLTEILVPVDKS